MVNETPGKVTVIQHLFMAKAKLLATHAALSRFGKATGEDPKALERVEKAMEHVGLAVEALSANEPAVNEEQHELPF